LSEKNKKYTLQKKKAYKDTDETKRKKARKLAEKLMGKNYFTNMQELMLRATVEMQERKKK
tara:strand:+ start:118 stop:300 length:183 start_codon:yes stop_codon:yes gene_type:complete